MALRIKPRHVQMLGELLEHGRDGAAAELLVGRGLPLNDLEQNGLAERFTDTDRILAERWRLTHAGDIMARFLTTRKDDAA